ncbi:MAG: NDP-hexose 2,3-dehydratase family protein [Bacteroidetes bacterium]|nr:NDP-hexose 2,3-dehydratase family protein [Bacteroidota bacterium]
MRIKDIENSFLYSALDNCGSYMSNDHFIKWINDRRKSVGVKIDLISFSKLEKWGFDQITGNLQHESKRFFSVEGIEVKTNWGTTNSWTQPIINQPEIGFLGIITKKINGVLHFLMQAKIEPGNINVVQLSPTLQATKSNYTRVHKGKSPLYIEYFNGQKHVEILLDQLQSEQGARFLKKRNRNIIVEVKDDIPIYEDFCWLTLGQLKELLRKDNLINMDTRTVLSGISFGSFSIQGVSTLFSSFKQITESVIKNRNMLISALVSEHSTKSLEEIIFWITALKSKYELEINKIPLNKVEKWILTNSEMHHIEHKYFSIIGANIFIENREVLNWSQPLVKSAQEGLIGFIVKKINGIYHFLVQAKIEAGNFDILELAPTVQCLTGNYRNGVNEYEVPFINEVLNAPEEKVIFKSFQSEEGGRFYQEQNLNLIIEASNNFSEELPENFCWMTLNQLFTFIKFNNYLNIQARSLLSAIIFQ